MALTAEFQRLQQELISQPVRVELMNAKLDRESEGMEAIEKRVESLRSVLHARRRSEAKSSQTEMEKTLKETAGLDPVLDQLAGDNAELARMLNQEAAEFDRMANQSEQAKKRRERIESDLADIQEGVIKSLVFGIVASLIAVWEGYNAFPTAEGVGRATTRTVVITAISVLILDFMITAVML